LIKATLSLAREMIPPTIHFQSPNPECRLAESPFFVNAEPLPWKRGDIPRRAGVSSFGVGGTNAHLVLEEAPALEPTRSTQTCQILPQSARTTAALDANSNNLCARLEADPELCLADAAFTLQTGRAAFKHRRAVVARDSASARAALRTRDPAFVFEGIAGSPKVVFMFPGGGTQEPGMGRALYETEPVYRATLDACAALFEAELGVDIRSALFAAEGAEAAEVLRQPLLNLPAIFATEVALTKLFLAWGITPSALIGHSLGEYTAACIAGVLSQEDAVALVALRARLYADLPGGAATLLVPLSEASIAPRLPNGVSLAAVNGPENCVVSGVAEAIKGFEAELLREGIEVRRLALTTAAHSPLLKPVAERLTKRAASMNLRSCCIPLVSNVTGTWLRDAESRDPSHWARHLCSPVRFADGIATLLADPDHVFVEVGPGRTLSSLTARQPRSGSARLITTSMAAAGSARTDVEAALGAAARLWCAGAPIHFEALHQGERRRRIPLPTYPFERTRYVIERAPRARTGSWTARTTPRRTPPTSTKEPRPSRPSIPMSPAEQALAGIWRELLGVEVLRPDDNFFDLGGDSLLAVRLRTKIRERFGVPLALHDLVESPTVGALAKRLHDQAQDLSFEGDPPVSSARAIGLSRRGAPPEGRLCVKLEEGDPRIRPLFLVQPLGGTVFTYLPLARALGGGIPVYGVRASGMEEGEPILNDVPAMASRYLEEIRALQPEGPFAIGGHSAGGVIAFEMARQLEAEGEEPGLVILLDALGPPKRVRSREDLLRELTSFRDIAPEAYRGLVAALRTDAALGSIMLAMSEALANYEACPIETEIAYIRAREDREPGDLHAEQAWMDRAKGAFTLHNVLGNHFTMMEPPNIAAVARVVRQHLMTLGPVRLEATAANG
ncbi:MAG: alpha/beta fold hydrolase, partial [Polyangiaceae bacterium]|nr:alpha/beta fold hydrolase [Polyangiaceae bacterium]